MVAYKIVVVKKYPADCSAGYFYTDLKLQLGACCDQSLTLVVAGVLLKVLDEAGGQILGLGLPLGSVCVGVAGIQDAGVNAGQSSGNFEIEVGDLLGLSLQDGAIQNEIGRASCRERV